MAVWSGTENFDSYNNLDPLGGLNGGTGWAGAWSANMGTGSDLVTTAQFTTSPNSLAWTGAGVDLNPLYMRSVTTGASGASTIVHVSFWISDTSSVNGGYWELYIADATLAHYCVIRINQTQGKIQVQANGGGANVDVLTGIASSTWYHCYIDVDVTNSRARGYAATTIPFATPTFSSYSTGSGMTTLDYAWVSTETMSYIGSSYLDEIRDVGSDFTPVSGVSRDARKLSLLNVG